MAKVMASNFHEIRIPIPPQIFAGQVLQEQAMCVLLFELMSVLEAGNDCGGNGNDGSNNDGGGGNYDGW